MTTQQDKLEPMLKTARFILFLVIAFFFGDMIGFVIGFNAGERLILDTLTYSYRPSQYFDHPGLLTADEKARMDNAYEQIILELKSRMK